MLLLKYLFKYSLVQVMMALIFVAVKLVVGCDGQSSVSSSGSGISNNMTYSSRSSSGSGSNEFPVRLGSTNHQTRGDAASTADATYYNINNLLQGVHDNDDHHDGNELSPSPSPSSSTTKTTATNTTRVVIKRSVAGGDSNPNTPDFKSLVHGLEAEESQISNEGLGGGDGSHPVKSDAIVVAEGGGSEINQLTALIATSLTALKYAAQTASNSSAYLQDMLTTVQRNSAGIITQVEVLKNLTVELGAEVAKPLRTMEPFIETQIDVAQSIASSVNKIGDQIQLLEQSISMLLTYSPILIVSSLVGNLITLIMLMCLLCTCVNMKRLRRAQEDIDSTRMHYTAGTLPFAFRNVELDEMNLRNSMRTQL